MLDALPAALNAGCKPPEAMSAFFHGTRAPAVEDEAT